jgi:hypothetical protein
VSNDPSQPTYRSARYRYKSAFTENANLLSLAGLFAASAALLNPIPLLVGLAAEAAYMLFVPDSSWYQRRLKSKFDAEVMERINKLKSQVFPQVHASVREQFSRLQVSREQIGQQSRNEETWFREALRKLDFLLEKHLHFGLKEAKFVQYLNSLVSDVFDDLTQEEKKKLNSLTSRGVEDDVRQSDTVLYAPSEHWNNTVAQVLESYYSREIEEISSRAANEQVFATKSILEKRATIIGRRQEFVGRIVQILNNLRHQMELMTDTFGLINDEIRARSPEQVLADIDEVVIQTNSLTEAIESVRPFDEIATTPISSS